MNNPPVSTNTPTFTDGATVQTWPTPGVPGCLPDVTPNWPGSLVTMDATAPVAPPIQTCYNNGALWTSSGRDTGPMAGSQCINDLENVSFDAPAGKLFTSVSIELKCLGPAARLHDVQVYYYISPGVLCEQQLIEPPLYAAKPHGAPGVNSYILDTVPSDTTCAAGFKRIEIEPQIGSACSVVEVNDFRTASAAFAATQVWSTTSVQGDLPDVAPDGPGALGNVDTAAPNAALICGAPDGQLSLTKTASPATYSAVGAVISYSYLVTNSGDVPLDGPFTVSDNKATASCPATASLAPGALITCTASYTIGQGDLDAGSVTNVASASNGAVTSPTDTETVTAVQNPHLALTKSASPATYNAVGNVINYTLVATNDGNVTLTGVSISDPTVGTLSCTPAQPATLAPGGTLSCTGSYTVAQAELDAGSISNTATATGMPVTYAATLSGPAEAPPNASPGVGNAIVDIDTSAHTLRVRATFSGLTGNTTASHIHAATAIAGAGTAGVATQTPTFAGFPLGVTAGTYDHTFDLTLASSWNPSFVTAHGGTPAGAEAFFAASVAAGKSYLNIHSNLCPRRRNPRLPIGRFLALGYGKRHRHWSPDAGADVHQERQSDDLQLPRPGHRLHVRGQEYGQRHAEWSVHDHGRQARDDRVRCGAARSRRLDHLHPELHDPGVRPERHEQRVDHQSRDGGGKFGNNTVTSNQAQATINQVAPTGKITPTNTTCQMFANGTNGDLLDELYKVKANKINSIAPGVFFYYSKITAPASSFTIQVTQSDILAWKKIGTMQIILWDANCVKTSVTGAYDAGTGTVTFNASGLIAGATYYISIKYDPGSLVGQVVPAGNPTDVYTFVTYLNGSQIIPSWDSVNVKSK